MAYFGGIFFFANMGVGGRQNYFHTPRGSCNNTLLRRVLRRFSSSRCFLEGFLEGAGFKGFSVKTRFWDRVS